MTLSEPARPLLATVRKIHKGFRGYGILAIKSLNIKKGSRIKERSSTKLYPIVSRTRQGVFHRSDRTCRSFLNPPRFLSPQQTTTKPIKLTINPQPTQTKIPNPPPSLSKKMCQKHHLSFWTPTDISDPSLEALVKSQQISETENPFADISRITYYECDANPTTNNRGQTRPKLSPTPLCPGRSSQPSIRQGPIRDFCASDDACEVRVKHFGKAFDAAGKTLADSRRGFPRLFSPQEVWEFQRKAERALGDWRAVWEAHGRCPARRCGDWGLCRLVNEGVVGRPVELWPERRLGENPFVIVLR